MITLAAARKNINLTQGQLAEIIGVSTNTLASWESGKTDPTARQFKRISEVTGISMDFLSLPEKSK